MYSTELGDVVFNPATRCFETVVSFIEGPETIRIPCSLRFPISADPAHVVPALIRQAREKRRMDRAPLVLRRLGCGISAARAA